MSFVSFIPTMTTGVVLRFNRLVRLQRPGLNFNIPVFQKVVRVQNSLCEKHCKIKVRTADKVFPELDITLQYRVVHQNSGKSIFQLDNPVEQMVSYADNIVRKTASHLTLDQLFESQSHLADAILTEVGPKMLEGGFTIESAQIRNIEPPSEVLKSMNEINASERRKLAAQNDGEAAKIKAVLLAEADAKEKQLRGKGIANMRANITEGWIGSVVDMAGKTKTDPKQILEFLIKVLQQETLENMSKNAGTKVIFVDKSTNLDVPEKKEDLISALEAYHHKTNENKDK